LIDKLKVLATSETIPTPLPTEATAWWL
jgi:hypothetical protein